MTLNSDMGINAKNRQQINSNILRFDQRFKKKKFELSAGFSCRAQSPSQVQTRTEREKKRMTHDVFFCVCVADFSCTTLRHMRGRMRGGEDEERFEVERGVGRRGFPLKSSLKLIFC